VFGIALHEILEVQGLAEGSADFSDRLMAELRSVSIPDGLSGPVFFDENGDRVGLYVMLSLRDTGYVEVGRYILGNLTVVDDVVFPDGTTNVPSDSIDLDKKTFIDFGDPIAIAFMTIAGVFMVLTLVVAILVIAYRRTSVLKAASIQFMLVILFGLLMGYSLVFVWSAKPTDATCMLRPWLGGIAFVLVSGALLTKSYRMWKVFDNQSLVLVVVSNKRLFQYLTVLMAMMLLILVLWTSIDRLKAKWEHDGILDQTQ
jgi:7 transmembrane sweet-taste receptor of 3 GCPR